MSNRKAGSEMNRLFYLYFYTKVGSVNKLFTFEPTVTFTIWAISNFQTSAE